MDNERPDILALLNDMTGVPPELKQLIEKVEKGPCQTPGCPAKVKYDEIMLEAEDGTMFDCNNLLVWIRADDLVLDRDERTFDMCAGEANRRQLV